MSEFNMSGFMGETSPGKESQVYPLFYRDSKYQPIIPGVREVPTSISIDMVQIRQAGEKDFIREEVNEFHKRRWPTQWQAYQAGREQAQDGTPIEMLYPGQTEVSTELKRFNVHTVEALANVADSAGAMIPFLTDRKNAAQAFLDRYSKAKGYDELQQQNAELMRRLEKMEELLNSATDPEKRAPGRPRKLETQEN